MTPEQLDQVAEKSASNLKELVGANNPEIREAMSKVLEDANEKAQETGGDPSAKISLNHKIEIDLVKDKQKDCLSWSVSHKEEIISSLPDPSQPELGLDENKEESQEEE